MADDTGAGLGHLLRQSSHQLQAYCSFDLDAFRASLHNMRSADLTDLLLAGELSGVTPGGQPAGAAGGHPVAAAAAAVGSREGGAPPAGPPAGGDAGPASAAPAGAAARRSGCGEAEGALWRQEAERSGLKRKRESLDGAGVGARQEQGAVQEAPLRGLIAPPPPLDLHSLRDGATPARISGRVSCLLMDEIPSVRDAFGAPRRSSFDLFDLGPSSLLNLNLPEGVGIPGSLACGAPSPGLAACLLAAAARTPAAGRTQQPRHGGALPPPPPLLQRKAGAKSGLPAALQPAPGELQRFGGAGLQLPRAQPGGAGGDARGVLPPMHVIERLL